MMREFFYGHELTTWSEKSLSGEQIVCGARIRLSDGFVTCVDKQGGEETEESLMNMLKYEMS